MKRMRWGAFGLILVGIGCSSKPDSPGLDALESLDQTPILATDTRLAFEPERTETHEGEWLRLDAGRVLLRPVVWPEVDRRCSISLDLTLRSAGDPWDKSGAVFAFADSDGRRFIERMAEGVKADTASFAGVMPSDLGAPALELMRFLTPFGVGHFSDHPKADSWRPASVDSWADSVHWHRDLSEFQPWFEEADTVWVGLYVDTWTAEGYVVDVVLRVVESDLACDVAPTHRIIPLWNTTRYAHDQRDYTGFPEGPLVTQVGPIGGRITCQLITTGHGGHEGGDEFTPQLHRLLWNGHLLDEWTPWRVDCGAFRRLNPSSGVWDVERAGRKERLASSDLSRSNWCPGSQVMPRAVDLGRVEGGWHELALEVPKAQKFEEDAFNFWNVSAYLRIDE